MNATDPGRGGWAAPVDRLRLPPELAGAMNLDGLRLQSPQQGFGRLWRRVYAVDIGAVEPAHAVTAWRTDFGGFWPRGADFRGAPGRLEPGSIAPIAMGRPGGLQLATGVLVIYADDESFTFMTPEGHAFAGWITFSAERREGHTGPTVLVIRILMRATDPLYEVGMPLMGRMEDLFWASTLRNLAAHFGVPGRPRVERDVEVVDPRRLWRNWRNTRYNAAVRSLATTVTVAGRALRNRVRPTR